MAATSGFENKQLMLVISDGRLDERERVERWVREAHAHNLLVVIIILDSVHGKDSILDLQSVTFEGGKLMVSKYMDKFPFWFYVVINDVVALPTILADALRQWFELMS